MTEPSTTHTVVLTVFADPNAPWTSVPVPSDFSSTLGTPTLSACSTTSCTATYTTISANGTITFTHNAAVKTPLPDGTLILGSATGTVTTAPTVGISNVDESAFPGQCSGTYTFVQRVEPSGAWLVDIKFADVDGLGKVILTPDGATQIRAWNDPLAEGDTIKIIKADGIDITAAVLTNAAYWSNDPSSPYYIGLAPVATQARFANADWLDSLNWPYDPDTFTGSTWLDAGTTIEVKREVTYLGCLPGGISGDGTSARPFGISTEVARATTVVDGSDYDAFSTPGTKAPATCASNLYVSSNTLTAATTFYQWQPANTTTVTVVPTQPVRSDAIASSSDYPSYIFSMNYSSTAGTTGGLKVYDTATGTVKTGIGLDTWAGGSATAMAFAPNGDLFAMTSGGNVRYLTAAQVSTFLNGGNVTWTAGPILSGSDGSATARIFAYDLAFDGDGNVWLTGRNSLYVFSASILKGAADSAVTLTTRYSLPTTATSRVIRGLAFVGDKLYLGVGLLSGSSTGAMDLYEIAWKTTVAVTALDEAALGFNVPALSDFASCSFPTKTAPPSGPAYKVQKSIANPDGSVAAPGTTGAAQTIEADGTVSIDYLVTVTNVGTQAGTFPTMTDSVSVPSGFTVTQLLVNGVAQASTTSFTIPGATLDPSGTSAPISRTYVITVKGKAASLANVDWTKAGTCTTTDGGTPSAGGFFNTVTMSSDTDGSSNNDACAPVYAAKLRLIKAIVDRTGALVATTDASSFTLTASGPTGISGTSASSGAVGPSGVVLPGTYRLGEQGNDGGTVSGQFDLYAGWACIDLANANAPVPVTSGLITLTRGMDVQCTIKNTKAPKVHIVKTATSPIADNTHIGQTITPAADGTFTANYTITVTNTSGFTTTTGPITDGFRVPAGLLWDGTKTATVTYHANGTGATATGLATSLTQAQLAAWARIATSVANLPNNASVSFTISIPLKIDNTVPSGSTQSVYETNATTLSSCASLTSTTGGTYTSFAGGIPNMSAINDEDVTYSSIAVEDNIACVPVLVPSAWAVEKATTGGVAGGTGPNLIATYDTVSNSFTATTTYTVKVTNKGTVAANHAAITDQIHLPTGFVITSVTLGGQALTVPTPGASTMTFTIPASITPVPAGGSVTYTIVVSASITNPSGSQWAAAGRCDTANAGTPTFGGFFNSVTLAGDTDGTSNNDACVPVQEPKKAISLQKFGMDCDVNVATCPVGGAQFAIYDVDPRTPGATPIPGGITANATVTNGVPGSVFSTVSLSYGKDYWLVEIQAPDGLSLLAQPVKFKVVGNGIWILPEAGVDHGTLVSVIGDQFTFSVINPTVAPLPKAGGLGFLPSLIAGLLLVGVGAAYHSKASGRPAAGFAYAGRAEIGRHRSGVRRAQHKHHSKP